VPECGGNNQIIRLKAEVLLLLRFANAHELQLNGVDGYQSQNDFTHTRRSHEFYHGAFPLSRSAKVAFPRALSA
jgi:hypothetical protein